MTNNSKRQAKLPLLLAFLVFPCLITFTSCGDDNLGGAFRARENTPDEAKYGPSSPLKAGTEHWYTLLTAYKRTAENDASGLTQHEVQGAGHLCVKIDEVKDIHTEDYKDEAETLVQATVKISGPSGATEMFVSDQDNASASAADVDPLLANLWLKRLVGPSAAHGYEAPASVNFRTQIAPIPSNFSSGLSILPFFEVRQLAKDLTWSGWTSLGGDLEGARNLTNEILGYFQVEPFTLDFMASSARFKTKITTPPDNCGDFSDPTTCAMKDCTWATPVDSAINTCMRLLRIGFSWRDTIRAPVTQAGDILHFLEFMYYDNGTLYKATEDIRPDTMGPEESLSANFPQTTCLVNCQSADLSIKGGFNDDPAYPAPCSF